MSIIIIMKTENYKFLENAGIAPDVIALVKNHEIKIGLSFKEVKLISKSDVVLGTYKMAYDTNAVMKGLVPPSAMEVIRGGITNLIVDTTYILNASLVKLEPHVSETNQGFPLGQFLKAKLETAFDNVPTDNLGQVSTGEKVFTDVIKPKKGNISYKSKEAKLEAELDNLLDKKKIEAEIKQAVVEVKELKTKVKNEVVQLSQATEMYQRVHGTSQGSVYFLVGITKEGAKVAAKIVGYEVSVRVEGKMPDNVVKAFSNVAVIKKDGYMSGHFTVNEQTPAARILGAVLLGSDLEFVTPMPLASRCKA